MMASIRPHDILRVRVVFRGEPAPGQRFDAAEPRKLIQPGDLLWCDVGFQALGLCTDQQQHAYVLKEGETDAPAGLKAALAVGNRLQDILTASFALDRTGNEILKSASAFFAAELDRPSSR